MSNLIWLLTTACFVAALAGDAQAASDDSNTTIATSAGASPEAASEPSAVAEIVVTAGRREQTLISVPQAVQALTAKVLANNGVEDLKSTLELIPGAIESSEVSAGTEVYAIRGVPAGSGAGGSTVGFYLDEFPFSLPGLPYAPSTNLYDVQRVEVIRGPSGDLYGEGSMGGTIKLLTNNPQLDSFYGSVRAGFGMIADANVPNNAESMSYATDAMANIPIVNDILGLRVVLSDERIGGYIHYPNIPQQNGNPVDSFSGRVKLLFQPTSKLSATFAYWYNNTNTGFTNRMDDYRTYEANDTSGHTPLSYSLYQGNVTYDLGFASLLSATNYLSESFGLFAVGNAGAPLGSYNIVWPSEGTKFSQEFRISSEGQHLINYTFGASYERSTLGTSNTLLLSGTPGFFPTFKQSGVSTEVAESYSVYGELSANLLNGRLIPTVGGRYFTQTQKLDGLSSLSIGGAPPAVVPDATSGRDKAFTPRFNLAFHPTGNGTIYIEAAEGFRPGYVQSHSLVETFGAINIPSVAATPADTLWNYEVGTKWNLFQKRLYAEISLYDFKWDNAQLQISPTGVPGIISPGNIEGRGVDLTLNYLTPITGLQLGLSGNANSTELHDVKPGVLAALPFLANGSQVPGTSPLTGSVDAEYTTPMARLPYDFRIMARYTYQSKVADASTGRYAADVGLLNFRAGFSDKTKSLMFYVTNATAEHGPLTIDVGRYVTPYPRQFGVTLETKF